MTSENTRTRTPGRHRGERRQQPAAETPRPAVAAGRAPTRAVPDTPSGAGSGAGHGDGQGATQTELPDAAAPSPGADDLPDEQEQGGAAGSGEHRPACGTGTLQADADPPGGLTGGSDQVGRGQTVDARAEPSAGGAGGTFPAPVDDEDPELRRWIATEERAARADPALVATIRRLGAVCGAAVATIGLAALLGWHTGLFTLTSAFPGLGSTKWWTALCLLLLGVGITATAARDNRATRALALLIGLLVTAVAATFLLEYVLDRSLGIDDALGPVSALDPTTGGGPSPGRMAAVTAACLILLGLGLALHKLGLVRLAQGLAVAATAMGFLTIVGYAFDTSMLFALARWGSMPLPTGIAVLLTGLAILSLRADRGYMRTIAGNTAGGLLARRMLPIAILLPPALGWIALTVVRAGAIDAAFAIAVVTTVVSLFNAVSIWIEANGLRTVDLQRAGTQAALDRLREAQARQRALTLELTESHRRTQAILDSALDAFIGMDDDGVITSWNPAAERLYGWPAAEAIGRRLDQLLVVYSADGSRMDARVDGGFLEHAIVRGPIGYSVVRKDGTIAEVESRVWAQHEHGQRRFTALVRDVAERNRVERELLDLNRSLDEFAAVAAHDLRGPLTAVSCYLELLEDAAADRDDSLELDLVTRAAHATDRGVRLIDDLLAYSRTGRANIATARVDLTRIARTLAAELPSRVDRECVVEVRELNAVSGDEAALRQVLTNLVFNAVHYCPADRVPHIVIGPADRADEPLTRLTISDNGDGIPADERERIFEMFARGSTGSDRPGTGVGLALCRRVVERHGGTIGVDDAPAADGAGARFTLTLPRHFDT